MRLDRVALVERLDLERVEARHPDAVRPSMAGADLEHRDRLVDAAKQRRLLLEDLHEHVRVAILRLEQLLRRGEVGVAGSSPPRIRPTGRLKTAGSRRLRRSGRASFSMAPESSGGGGSCRAARALPALSDAA